MNFSKAKSLFIALFVILDIFLFIFYINNSSIISVDSSANYQKVIKILGNKSILVDASANKIISQTRLYNLSLLNPSADKDSFLSSVLGNYTKKDENTFVSEKGIIVFKGNEFMFYPKQKEKINSLLPSAKTAETLLKTLETYGFDTSFLKWYTTMEEKKGFYKITYNQIFYEKELFNSNVSIYATENGISHLKGCLYSPFSVSSEIKNLKSKEEILIRFSNLFSSEKKIIITKINNGYYISKDDFKTLTAIPSLEISTKNGDIYYFDLLNGEFLEKLSVT